MFTTTSLSAALAVDESTIKNWVGLGRLGRKEGRQRVFDHGDAFAIGLLAALLKAGVPVNYSAIESAKILAASTDRPATVRIRGSDVASVDIDLVAAAKDINRKLGITE